MLKKLLILLCSTSLLVANQSQETNNPCDSELSTFQTFLAYQSMACTSLGISAAIGQMAVSYLPEKANLTVKSAVFVPVALTMLMAQILYLKEIDMMGFYKKHKKLVYLPGAAAIATGAFVLLMP